MSWLFPLYALGALALAAPIVFHLFQRRPHGKQEFSSLMFLKASPPKLTRRSRLSDLLLLLLRAAVLLLLAAAFARPFLRSTTLLDTNSPTRSVALLVDTSASMRRDGMWEQMQSAIDEVVRDLRPTDQVMLMGFDRTPEMLISFEAWEETNSSQRMALLNEQIGSLTPSWYATDFSSAMIEAADALLQQRLLEDSKQPLQVVAFTDLQDGIDISGLQTYEWPKDVTVDVRTIAAKQTTNASVMALPAAASETDAAQIRVLVRNEADSERAQFQLTWAQPDARPVRVYVPPGQTRVVRVTQPAGARQLTLSGDDHDYDNNLFLSETKRKQQQLFYLGDDAENDKEGAYFYLKQASLDTRTREVALIRPEATAIATATPKTCPLMIVSSSQDEQTRNDLRRYVERGGRALVLLNQAKDSTELASMQKFVSGLLDVADLEIAEADERDYAMLAKIDFQHPIFQAFADPRYSDFTKIRYWSHRVLNSSQQEPWTTPAVFDDDAPAIVEKRIGEGTIWVLTSGWQPNESQLALSTKFIPLLHAFYGRSPGNSANVAATWTLGETIAITPQQSGGTVIGPSGQIFDVEATAVSFSDADEPGIYTLKQGGLESLLAVNLAAAECRTKPLMPDRLEQLGVTLGEQKSVEALKSDQRLMRNKELESSQKLWRWGILAALAFVAVETWMGGRAAAPSLSGI